MIKSAPRAAAYIRVSTKGQADHRTSLADQQNAIERFCAAERLELVKVYIEAGASATDENRPVFQEMIQEAAGTDRPFDTIVVHSASRFFRDAFQFESYRRRLKRNKVSLKAVTQSIDGDDPMTEMTRHILTGFDQYQSAETGKHTSRTMVANARNGYWNGGRAPFGYRAYVAELHGDKAKMKLEPHPDEAPVVQIIFDLYLNGDGRSGPMGLRRLIDHLHGSGLTHRGTPFHVSTMQTILRREAYVGRFHYNRLCVKSGEKRERDDWIVIPIPALVDEATFASVQRQLTVRRRSVSAPRHVNGPSLLSAIGRCGQPGCDRHLTRLTGKSGQYAYYACAGRAYRATATCEGVRMRAEALDDLVLSAVEEQVLESERLTMLLANFLDLSEDGVERKRADLALFRAERTRAEKAIAGLYELVEAGLDGPSNRTFAERLATHQRRLAALEADIAKLERQVESRQRRITPQIVEDAAHIIRQRLRGNDPAFRRAYVLALIDEVVLTPDEVRIRGPKAALERLVTVGTSMPTMVPAFDREWCRLQDSNL